PDAAVLSVDEVQSAVVVGVTERDPRRAPGRVGAAGGVVDGRVDVDQLEHRVPFVRCGSWPRPAGAGGGGRGRSFGGGPLRRPEGRGRSTEDSASGVEAQARTTRRRPRPTRGSGGLPGPRR